MTSGILDDLNEPQKIAVTHGEGPLLILAGAGSGKTRVITRRVAYLILERGVDPRALLAITFTNKAAREMKERVLRWIPRGNVWISTFHAMCARILRQDVESLGLHRDFTIYDTHDRDLLLREILKDQNMDTTRFRPAAIGSAISSLKNRMVRESEVSEKGSFFDGVVSRAYQRYSERMRDLNALDFDDLLLFTLDLFDRHPSVRDRYATRFQYLLIDEFQDTNRVQYLLVKHLAGKRKNICSCGDPDQSIYKWRGADPRNILNFEKDFGETKTVKLEQNYRSTQNILSVAEAVIRNNLSRKEKALWTQNPKGDLVVLLPCDDEKEEAREIAAQIRALHAGGRPYGEIAIFYRVNFLQRALEAGLREGAIPYQVVAGVEFFERKEIKDLLAYLRILVNSGDDLSLARILNVPPRGIGEVTIERFKQLAQKEGKSLLQMLFSKDRLSEFPPRAKKALDSVANFFKPFSFAAKRSAADVLGRIIEEIGFYDHLRSLGDPRSLDRVENVEELLHYAQDYDQREPEGKLRGFLNEVALISSVDRMEEEADRVALMTLHSAKGLEFPVVIIAGCEEGLLPHARSMEGEADLEEERRLFYVGVTRAQEKLFLTYSRSRLHPGAMSQGSSRFLEEIPDSLLEKEEEAPSLEVDSSWEAHSFRSGDVVRHAHFGVGQVVTLQGSGVNTRILVNFNCLGPKMLLLPYANLEKAEPEK